MSEMERAASDRLIQLSHEAGLPLSHLPLQKLLYFVEGWHLALTGTPLFDEEFEAWAKGPVLPTVYRRLKDFGAEPISEGVVDTRPEHVLAPRVLDIIDQVFRLYAVKDPKTLVGLTHLPGTPWERLRAERGVPPDAHLYEPISTDSIREWFSSVWDAALEPKSSIAIDADPIEYEWWTAAES